METIKPTLTQKETYAHEIKMEMLEWKKKFFINVAKIKETFNKTIEEKYEWVFSRLYLTENSLSKLWEMLEEKIKNETELFRKNDFQIMQNFLEPALLNQKEIVIIFLTQDWLNQSLWTR